MYVDEYYDHNYSHELRGGLTEKKMYIYNEGWTGLLGIKYQYQNILQK